MSPSKRWVLVRREVAAPQLGIVRATMRKIGVDFFGGARGRTNARVGIGRVGRGLGKGGGGLLALGSASCLVEETLCQRDGNFIIVTSFLVAGGSIFTPWERQTPDFGDVVARASDTPAPLHRQNRERNLAS